MHNTLARSDGQDWHRHFNYHRPPNARHPPIPLAISGHMDVADLLLRVRVSSASLMFPVPRRRSDAQTLRGAAEGRSKMNPWSAHG